MRELHGRWSQQMKTSQSTSRSDERAAWQVVTTDEDFTVNFQI
jgi:hypothetical protein